MGPNPCSAESGSNLPSSAPNRNHIQPAADPAPVARLAASGMPGERRRKKVEFRRQRRRSFLQCSPAGTGGAVKSLERRVPDGRENAWPCRANCFQYPGGDLSRPANPQSRLSALRVIAGLSHATLGPKSECPAFVAPGPSGSTKKPARALTADFLKLEPTLSDLINQGYALTSAETQPMWQTAPPRTPIPPPPAT
jgi:hypothetical protein